METPKVLRLGVLVSGGGRTALNIHERIVRGELAASIEVVISSRPKAGAVERCRAAGLTVEVVDRRALDDRPFHQRIADLLRSHDVDLVCMAGFLTLWRIPSDFLGRVVNIHPALLPDFGGEGFYGDRVHRAVLESGARQSGCTAHFADNTYDHGSIILQRKVSVLDNDTTETLAARVFEQESAAYPEVIAMFADGRLVLPGR